MTCAQLRRMRHVLSVQDGTEPSECRLFRRGLYQTTGEGIHVHNRYAQFPSHVPNGFRMPAETVGNAPVLGEEPSDHRRAENGAAALGTDLGRETCEIVLILKIAVEGK